MPVNRQHVSLNDPTYEDRMQQAIHGLHEGRYKNISEAARVLKLARSTLNDRHKGTHASRSVSHEAHRLLNDAQEKAILDNIESDTSHGRIRTSSLRSLVHNLTGKSVGKNWPKRFATRHSELMKTKSANRDPAHDRDSIKSTVESDGLLELEEKYGPIPPNQIWNMDEKGIQLGLGGRKEGKKHYFFSRSESRSAIHSDNIELVMVVECISAAGHAVPATFILPSGPVPDFQGIEDIGKISTSESGWTDCQHTASWIKDTFLPCAFAHTTDRTKPIVLILDGHDSHESHELKRAVYRHSEGYDVIVVCFPPQWRQPLDALIFYRAQDAWRNQVEELTGEGNKVTRQNVVKEYIGIRRSFMTGDLIQQAFATTGVYPWNPDALADDDSDPSRTFSTKAHVPTSYPGVSSSRPTASSSSEDDINDPESDEDEEPFDFDYDEGNVVLIESEFYGGHGWRTSVPSTLPVPRPPSHPSDLDGSSDSDDSDIEAEDEDVTAGSGEHHTTAADYAQRYEDAENSNADDQQASEHNEQSPHSELPERAISRLLLDPLEHIPLDALRRLPPDMLISHVLNLQGYNAALMQVLRQSEAGRSSDHSTQGAVEPAQTTRQACPTRRAAAPLRIFKGSLSSYQRKRDLVDLAQALEIASEGTIPQLKSRIRGHLRAHPLLARNPRFRALFPSRGRHAPLLAEVYVFTPPNPPATYASSSTLNADEPQ
ncbi:hypothetical protein EUX98_g6309 [Antrodiella citrinella]|uniref:DDE-1 domain-containing protein n=1 Tax=Antrodiella citrinella TaxID=2447956 RepID=A0A4S4MPF6_9APHY|nr:hypothetical protein EUX98_g6309 [Antrodiella citrinella]